MTIGKQERISGMKQESVVHLLVTTGYRVCGSVSGTGSADRSEVTCEECLIRIKRKDEREELAG